METSTNGHPASTISRPSLDNRRSNTAIHLKSAQAEKRRSYDSSKPSPDQSQSLPDDNSLTSFPSLSPSLENSPDAPKDDVLSRDPATAGEEIPSPTKVAPQSLKDLFVPETNDNDRSSLFFDGPRELRDVPGALHLQSNESVSHVISRVGAVKLVKQLSEDLAQRDAHVTLVQRKAEERERLLRKMLREAEISNLDIETRLKELERAKASMSAAASVRSGQQSMRDDEHLPSDASIDDRMQEALSDEVGEGLGINGGSVTRQNRHPRSLRPNRQPSQISEQSGFDNLSKSGTGRGWKSFFSGSGTIRKASGQRSALVSDEAAAQSQVQVGTRRPSEQSTRASSIATSSRDRQLSLAGSDSSASGPGVASWALRIVGGSAQGSQQAHRGSSIGGKTAEGRTNTIRKGTMTGMRSPRGSTSSAYGPNGTLRRVPSTSSHQSLSGVVSSHSPQASVDGTATNLGPVEMDTILPEDTRPPTLGPTLNTTDLLTDNFGFIYDHRRRRKMKEATAAMPRNKRGSQVESLQNLRRVSGLADLESDAQSTASQSRRPDTPQSIDDAGGMEPTKKWQDYLKFTSLKTELLSHTPSPGPITDITTSEPEPASKSALNMINMSERGSVPALSKAPEPAATRIVSDNAELVSSTSQPASPGQTVESEHDPVKALVDHLAEVHEFSQREKTHKWNDFLRKVRADRRKDVASKADGDQRRGSSMPETLLTDGEVIGVAGLGIRGKVGKAKGTEFRNLVLAGIPTAYRSKIWAECSGAVSLRVPGYYEELTNSPFTDETIVQQIQMDITRTLTDNVYYRRGAGVEKLKEVLLAYARRNPDIGYCQGMNMIAANLLLIMPTAEDAFWVLTSMVENILPDGYYSPSLLTSRADQIVLRRYVTDILPGLSTHLIDLNIELEALTFQWFLSVFTDCLSAEALFRVWDVVICLPDTPTTIAPKITQTHPHGAATFLFQVALALLKLNEKSLLACDNPAEVYRYINRGMTDHAISIDNLIRASEGLRKEVKMEDVLERRREAVEDELELMHRREMIRKGKSKASLAPEPGPAPATPKTNGNTSQDVTPKPKRQISKKLVRQPSRAELDEEREAQEYEAGMLTVRTPMPIEEEFDWRA